MNLINILKSKPGYSYRFLETYNGLKIAFFYKIEMDDDKNPYMDDCFATDLHSQPVDHEQISDEEWDKLKEEAFKQAIAARERMLRGHDQ